MRRGIRESIDLSGILVIEDNITPVVACCAVGKETGTTRVDVNRFQS